MRSTLTPQAFVKKWSGIRLKEISAYQSHFIDVCALAGHPTPTEADPHGAFFTFESVTEKTGASRGRADVWYKDHFIWEYKGGHADLDRAYRQLLLYREALGNPPLLITSDTQTILLHTNFTGTVKQVHEIPLERLLADGVDLLKRAFTDPQSFQPRETQADVTQATAGTFAAVMDTLKKWHPGADPMHLAHFVIRLLFCLFAEDTGLLPDHLFAKLVNYRPRNVPAFQASLQSLFGTMRGGGVFGQYPIPEFDGTLFDDDSVPALPGDVLDDLSRAAQQDWSAVDPSIFGTLFERAIAPGRRAQLGAHYTGRDDILLIVEPVLMRPLRDRWLKVKAEARALFGRGDAAQADALLRGFSGEIAATRILDPACGSGNFLYVALRQLLDLQKEVIAFANREGPDPIPLTVSPHQLYGLDVDPYAHQLAQVVVWIGYLQWRFDNGLPVVDPPILRPLDNIQCRDAILTYDAEGRPAEPEWPQADVVIGNPPFLGGGKLRSQLGDAYVEALFRLYRDRLPNFSDLVCYWFEKARAQIESGKLKRAGLLATQGIRGGANRTVLERIKQTSDIFWAQSDRPWVLDGANVHVSMVGFDDGRERTRLLDDRPVPAINTDLTATADLTQAQRLHENMGICFMGPSPKAPFDIDASLALRMLSSHNPSGRSNQDVVRPVASGIDLAGRPRNKWTIDFGLMPLDEAAQYVAPFEYVKTTVLPARASRRDDYRGQWWQYARPRPELRTALHGRSRFVATPEVSKHRIFAWVRLGILANQQTLVFARDDDYFFGVLHSRPHELWARRQGTQLREVESGFRYTPTSTFETFPFPWPPGHEPSEDQDPRVAAIAQAARDLVALRDAWLHPSAGEIGVTISQSMLDRRTLTNLYNDLVYYREQVRGKARNPRQWEAARKGITTLELVEELDHVHTALDHAVLDAYGWPHALSDDEVLERLLALNLERAGGGPAAARAASGDTEQ